MENATKALLIAAAVLVVIILIAFGMRILNSGSGTQDQADATMNSAKAQAFNQKFEAYRGNNVSPSSVRNLFTLIAQNNQSDPTHAIKNFQELKIKEKNKFFDDLEKSGDLILDFSNDNYINLTDMGLWKVINNVGNVENNKTYIVRFVYEESGENIGYIKSLLIISNTK